MARARLARGVYIYAGREQRKTYERDISTCVAVIELS